MRVEGTSKRFGFLFSFFTVNRPTSTLFTVWILVLVFRVQGLGRAWVLVFRVQGLDRVSCSRERLLHTAHPRSAMIIQAVTI